jgi:RNA polymerase sigma factor (sigma-70 family)
MTTEDEHGASRDRELATEHDDRLREFYDGGARTYGRLPLSFPTFARRVLGLATRLAASQWVGPVLDRVSGEDLYLTIACDEQVPGSWETFTRVFVPRLEALAQRRGSLPRDAEEVVRELPGDLALPPTRGGARTRLGTFEGTASLFSWLAVIVLRRLSDRFRARPEPELAREPVTSSGPSDVLLDEETARRFERALHSAWSRLTDREALAVLYKYRRGLQQLEIARLLGVGPPRVTRLLQSAVEKMRAHIDEELREGLPGSGTDPDRCWRALEAALEKQIEVLAEGRRR